MQSRTLYIKLYPLTFPFSSNKHLRRSFPSLMTNVEDKSLEVITNNQAFFANEINRINLQERPDQVIVGYTAWPDYEMNDLLTNGKKSKSCLAALPIIQSYLNENCQLIINGQSKVVLDPFSPTDFYNDKAPGESYKEMLKAYENNETQFSRSTLFGDRKGKITVTTRGVYDINNVTDVYAYVHRAKILHPNDVIFVDYYVHDENTLRRNALEEAFSEGKALPKGVLLRINIFDDELKITKTQEIIGFGDTNYHFPEAIKKLVDYKPDVIRNSENPVNIIKTNAFTSLTNFGSEVTDKKLLQANYTTAAELAEKGLIPSKHVLDADKQKQIQKIAKQEAKLKQEQEKEKIAAEKAAAKLQREQQREAAQEELEKLQQQIRNRNWERLNQASEQQPKLSTREEGLTLKEVSFENVLPKPDALYLNTTSQVTFFPHDALARKYKDEVQAEEAIKAEEVVIETEEEYQDNNIFKL